MTTIEITETLKSLMAASDKAHRALLNDPRCLADKNATHTPELLAAWEAAADRECAFRKEHGLLINSRRR